MIESISNIVTPLQRFLARSSVDDLLNFIHALHLQFALVCNAKGVFSMEIFQEGTLRYRATNSSAKYAIIDALARFLADEKKDFQEYIRKGNDVAATGRTKSQW